MLVDDNGNAVLTDFGRAFIIDEIEASRSLNAAAHWTAPEVLMEEGTIPLTQKSDVWSLAVTIFEVRGVHCTSIGTIITVFTDF